jgi:hypothetical protein
VESPTNPLIHRSSRIEIPESMTVYQINPLQDARWREFLEAHPQASIFHTPEWLECLRRSYGYEPFVLTTSAPGSALTNGVVFCRVKSWLTGERVVSVPFADHCQPLFAQVEDFYAVLQFARDGMGKRSRKPVEVRPLDSTGLELVERDFNVCKNFRIHLLDLTPAAPDLLKGFDKDSVQRRLRRAEKENLVYEEGNGLALVKKFYQLMLLTRRKHQVPPQPLEWFENLVTCLGDRASVRLVSKGDIPIASIVSLSYNGTMIYKYGCSDAEYNNLAGTPFLFWKAIQDAKAAGAHTFDMGRSDLDNPGLLKFKSNWGTKDLPLTYWRCPQKELQAGLPPSRKQKIGGYVVSRLPDNLLILLGRMLYKHIG